MPCTIIKNSTLSIGDGVSKIGFQRHALWGASSIIAKTNSHRGRPQISCDRFPLPAEGTSVRRVRSRSLFLEARKYLMTFMSRTSQSKNEIPFLNTIWATMMEDTFLDQREFPRQNQFDCSLYLAAGASLDANQAIRSPS